MRLLILGGTKFVGRAIVEAALARGHEASLFNRGQTNPDLFPGAEHLHGDRLGDLSALSGRDWDAVVDASGYSPHAVRASTELLARSAEWYGFVSTLSVYADLATGPTESSATQVWDGRSEDRRMDYGALKVACEDAVREHFGERAFVARLGVVAGPHDPTYRATYWIDRVAAGGDVLAPEPHDAPVQLLDARDLGDWLVRCAETRAAGLYNVTGETLTMEGFLEACREASGSDARLVWVEAEFLAERFAWMKGVVHQPRSDTAAPATLPLFIDPAHRGLYEVDTSRALAAGFRPRQVEETIRDTLAWSRSGAPTFEERLHGISGVSVPRPGLSSEQEQELLRQLAPTR